MEREVVVIAHNLRSCHNVGSLLRTAEGLGLSKVYLTGYTPYPAEENDTRMPHISKKISAKISKTALGSQQMVSWEHVEDIAEAVANLKTAGYTVVALEQGPNALPLPDYAVPMKIAAILGREVEGIESEILELADHCIHIPMLGQKESYNVVQAAAMALYHFRFI